MSSISGETDNSFGANSTPVSPFSGKYFDGVYGFEAKLFVGEYRKESVSVNLLSNFETPKKWTIAVKAEKEELLPNVGCEAFSQTSEWKFVLAQSIDPHSLEYEFLDGFLTLRAKHKVVEEQQNRGSKRKEINTEFSDRRAKRFRKDLNLEYGSGEQKSTETEEDSFLDGIFSLLPVEVISHVLQFLDEPNQIRKCAFVSKSWKTAVQLLNLPTILTMDDSFFTPAKYLNFMEVFQNYRRLPFNIINYTYKDTPNIGQYSVLDWIIKRGSRVKIVNVTLRFEQYNGRQYCSLLEWISNFKSCRYMKVRINDYVPGIPIDYGNCDLSHVEEFEMSALIYKQMQDDLQDRFPLNKGDYKVLHAYYEPQVPSDSQ